MALIKNVKGIKPNIGQRCFLADNATITGDVVIQNNSIIAAGALVTRGTQIEANSVYAGIPARKIKATDKELSEGEIMRIAASYNKYAKWYSL